MQKFWYWLPRGLAIALVGFVSLLALDVFGEGYTFAEIVLALLIHLMPSYILIGLTWLAWKREKLGGVMFVLVGLGFAVFTFNREDLGSLVVAVPLVIVGGLFWLSKRFGR